MVRFMDKESQIRVLSLHMQSFEVVLYVEFINKKFIEDIRSIMHSYGYLSNIFNWSERYNSFSVIDEQVIYFA